jgi:magnesium-transporting ATPase (P-type)
VNKRGNISLEIIGTFILLIMFFIIGGFVLMLVGSFNDELQQADVVPDSVKAETQNYSNLTTTLFDGMFIFYLLILWAGTLITSYFLDNSPLFFAIFVILGIITFFIMIPLANMVMAMNEGIFGTFLQLMPMTLFVIQNMALFVVIYLISVGFALYVKTNRGGYY